MGRRYFAVLCVLVFSVQRPSFGNTPMGINDTEVGAGLQSEKSSRSTGGADAPTVTWQAALGLGGGLLGGAVFGALGAISGFAIGAANNQTGWNDLAYMAGGMLLGGAVGYTAGAAWGIRAAVKEPTKTGYWTVIGGVAGGLLLGGLTEQASFGGLKGLVILPASLTGGIIAYWLARPAQLETKSVIQGVKYHAHLDTTYSRRAIAPYSYGKIPADTQGFEGYWQVGGYLRF